MEVIQANPSFRELVESMESREGLALCLKSMSASAGAQALLRTLSKRHGLHLTEFCLGVKVHATERCRQCDLRDIPAKAIRLIRPFVNRCHAGADEIIIPLIHCNTLVAIGYLGQFRQGDDQPQSLPQVNRQRLESLLIQALLLQRYFLYELENATAEGAPNTSRQKQIHAFLQSRFKQNPSLEDLARHLSLSVSRTGHLVKEINGRNFVDLRQHYQLEAARKMLANTLLTIEQIAEESGFGDPRYFYRVFKQASGLPPARWRTEQRSAQNLKA